MSKQLEISRLDFPEVGAVVHGELGAGGNIAVRADKHLDGAIDGNAKCFAVGPLGVIDEADHIAVILGVNHQRPEAPRAGGVAKAVVVALGKERAAAEDAGVGADKGVSGKIGSGKEAVANFVVDKLDSNGGCVARPNFFSMKFSQPPPLFVEKAAGETLAVATPSVGPG